jgi:hypothetical protein
MASVFIGYGQLLPPESTHLMTWTIAVASGFMVSAFLAHGATGRLGLSVGGVGPLEMRLVFIGIYLTVYWGGSDSLLGIVPWVLVAALGVLSLTVYRQQQELWKSDRWNNTIDRSPRPPREPL